MNKETSAPVSPDQFRRGMRHVPTVVTVVTHDAVDGPIGLTIGSFVSLSLEPPLICFNVQKDSTIHDRLVKADRFLVHVLRDDQAAISDQFAVAELSTKEQMLPGVISEGPHGLPSLSAYLVRFDCRTTVVYDGGDHSIILGCVEGMEEGTEEEGKAAARPIVYHQRAYHAIGTHVADRSTL